MWANLVRYGYKAAKFIKQYSPEIMMGLGAIGLGYTGYKIYKVRPEIDAIVTDFEERKEAGEEVDNTEVVVAIAKKVAVPTVVGVASFAMLFGSYRIQKIRIAGLSSALGLVAKEKIQERAKFLKEFGKEKYKEFYKPVEKVVRSETNENGEEVEVVDYMPKKNLMDGVWFSNSDEFASDDGEYNEMIVKQMINKIELAIFRKDGLYLNEVLEMLQVPKEKIGGVLGWTYDNFRIQYEVIYDTVEGTTGVPDIYISWTQPEYVYDRVSYTGAVDSEY